MVLYGHAIRVGDAIGAAQILAPDLWDAGDPALLAAGCLAGADPAIAERVREGDILVSGQTLGAGAGQEQAVLALLAAGFAAVVCVSADPGFVAEAHVYGLPVLACPPAAAALADGALVRVDLATGCIEDRAGAGSFQAPPCPPALLAAVRQAQLLARTRRVIEEEGFDG